MSDPELNCTVQISEEARDAMRSVKRGDQTYDDLIRAMLCDFEPERPDPAAVLQGGNA